MAPVVGKVLALHEIDREEDRLNALIQRLEGEIAEARALLQDAQIARKFFERMPSARTDAPTNGHEPPNDVEEEKEGKAAVTIKEAALKALRSAYPKGYEKSGIEMWIKKNLGQEVNSGSLSVMLARLRDRDGAVRNAGNVWVFVPEKERKTP